MHKSLIIYRGKTVLITGDTGFKGSWLAIWLLKLGAKVIGYGLSPRTKKDNYNVCGLNKKITHITGDIRDFKKLKRTIDKYKPTAVFHLAAQPLVIEATVHPQETFSTNVMGTVNLLEAVRQSDKVKVCIMVSSDRCYLDPVYTSSESDPLGGREPYGASMAAAEIVTMAYARSYFFYPGSACIASVRASNVLGGGDWSPDRLFPDCIKALHAGKPIVLRNPRHIRPWQHVLEPLFGYLLLGSSLLRNKREYRGAWNFGPENEDIMVQQLAEKIIKYWGSGRISAEPNQTATRETQVLRLDNSKSKKILGWKPLMSINQAVKLAVDEYKIDGMKPEAVYKQRLEHIELYENW